MSFLVHTAGALKPGFASRRLAEAWGRAYSNSWTISETHTSYSLHAHVEIHPEWLVDDPDAPRPEPKAIETTWTTGNTIADLLASLLPALREGIPMRIHVGADPDEPT